MNHILDDEEEIMVGFGISGDFYHIHSHTQTTRVIQEGFTNLAFIC